MRLAEEHNLLPERTKITGRISILSGERISGGCGDVKTGLYRGGCVAVKTLRISRYLDREGSLDGDAIKQARKVGVNISQL